MCTFGAISGVGNLCILVIIHLVVVVYCNGFEINIDNAEALLKYNVTTDCDYAVLLKDSCPEKMNGTRNPPPDTLTQGFWFPCSANCEMSFTLGSIGLLQSVPSALTFRYFIDGDVFIRARLRAKPSSEYENVVIMSPGNKVWAERSLELDKFSWINSNTEISFKSTFILPGSPTMSHVYYDKLTFTFEDQVTEESTFGTTSEHPTEHSTLTTSERPPEQTTEHILETTTSNGEILFHIDTSEDMRDKWINTCTYQKHYFHYHFQNCPMLASDPNAHGWNGTGFWSSCTTNQCIIAYTISGHVPSKIGVLSFVTGSASIRVLVRVGATIVEVKTIKNSNWENVISDLEYINLEEGSVIMLQPSGVHSLANINLIGGITFY